MKPIICCHRPVQTDPYDGPGHAGMDLLDPYFWPSYELAQAICAPTSGVSPRESWEKRKTTRAKRRAFLRQHLTPWRPAPLPIWPQPGDPDAKRNSAAQWKARQERSGLGCLWALIAPPVGAVLLLAGVGAYHLITTR